MKRLSPLAFGLENPNLNELCETNLFDLKIGEPKISPFSNDVFDKLKEITNINYYYPSMGDSGLRNLILKKYYPRQNTDNIAITHGAIGAIDLIFRLNLSADSEILIPDPGFGPYTKLAEFSKATIKKYLINLDHESSNCIDWENLESLITDNTKIILLNTPHNPTGKIFTEIDYNNFINILNKYPNVSFIMDEVYRELIYGNLFHYDFSFFLERGYIVGSFSKMYPLQGARIGWILTSNNKMEALIPYFNNTMGAISSFGQELAKILLLENLSYIDKYSEALTQVTKILNDYQVDFVPTAGSFFVFIKYQMGGDKATEQLRDLGVEVLSGAKFGSHSSNYIRASFAQESPVIQEAFTIIAKHWSQNHSRIYQ